MQYEDKFSQLVVYLYVPTLSIMLVLLRLCTLPDTLAATIPSYILRI
jgi:hypothetical protein